ncbi:D-beta-hydroxybutyrate dehydrogenase [Streptomyces sparsogenes DSM 40356]|uniref:D-beta-hydroxybutyrate dehydrogenase n=1 Tax=Streptomyces sparsogenes DSM 40356 TaxID=1331668 RepID=A0A1R1SBV1_9ACTN|nr:D-beta-hydroxybutyrate dehydrogenase [Streptomyces sparsogenes DSM 40356]
MDSVLLESAALKRLVEPEEEADAVAFLCGPQATAMTGTDLVIDGGYCVDQCAHHLAGVLGGGVVGADPGQGDVFGAAPPGPPSLTRSRR